MEINFMEEIEIWESLVFLGYPNYEVSNIGRVKSLKFGKERILKQGKMKNGYLFVVLCENGKRKLFYVHKLVAIAFIPNPQNIPIINHKDENKENNCLNNLEWVSYQYNNTYNNIHKKRGLKTGKTRKKTIQQYTKDMVFVKEFESATTASTELNIPQSNITACCKGRLKTSGGFIWKYKY